MKGKERCVRDCGEIRCGFGQSCHVALKIIISETVAIRHRSVCTNSDVLFSPSVRVHMSSHPFGAPLAVPRVAFPCPERVA